MRGQPSLPDEMTSLPLQVETDNAALSKAVASQRITRLLWNGLGFSVLVLLGLSTWALHPLVSHASAQTSRLVPEIAYFNPMALLGPGGIDPAVDASHVAQRPVAVEPAHSPAESWPEGMGKIYHFTDEKVVLGDQRAMLGYRFYRRSPMKDMLGHLPEKPTRFQRAKVDMSAGKAVLERPKFKLEKEYEPPSPPPPPSGKGGGGPGGEGGDIYLRRISGKDAKEIVENWIARIKLEDQFSEAEIAEVQKKALAELDVLLSFSTAERISDEEGRNTNYEQGRIVETRFSRARAQARSLAPTSQFFVALYAHDEKTVTAVAGGTGRWLELNHGAMVINYLSISPLELGKEDSLAELKMRQGLRLMASDQDLDLIMDVDKLTDE